MKLNYSNRDFNGIRQGLINYAKSNYNIDITPASIDLLFIDMISGVGDLLSYNTDKKLLETQLEYAQERESLLSLARTYGLKIPNKKPSISVCEFTVTVPVYGDSYDKDYTPIIKSGMQVYGGGQTFEVLDDIDFNSDYSYLGVPNRKIIPIINTNEDIVSYNIIKQELVVNGITKIGFKTVTTNDHKPFLKVVIPDNDVLSVEQVIQIPTLPFNQTPSISDFYNENNRFYEVESLVESKVFLDDNDSTLNNNSLPKGNYKEVSKRFITEYNNKGNLCMIFGGGVPDNNSLSLFNESIMLGNIPKIRNYINNDALGEIPALNETIYYRYRVGGGKSSNVGKNVLTNIGNHEMIITGNNQNISSVVRRSLTVNNPIPALGGNDEPSIEHIRKMISYNFSAQNRCITTRDYVSRVFQMNGRYGNPFRVSASEVSNKIVLSILSLDSNNKLNNTSNTILKKNISNYLVPYKGINDFVEIEDAKIINLRVECDILIDKSFVRSEVNGNVIKVIRDYFDVNDHDLNENVYISQLIEKVNNVNGVLNVIDIRFYNLVGFINGLEYSYNETSMGYINEDNITKQIELIDGTLFGEDNGIFEIKYPNKDIVIRNKIN